MKYFNFENLFCNSTNVESRVDGFRSLSESRTDMAFPIHRELLQLRIITLTRIHIEIRWNSQKRAHERSNVSSPFRDKSAYSNLPAASNLTIYVAASHL